MKLRALLAALFIAAPVTAAPLPEDHSRLVQTMANNGMVIGVNQPSICRYGNVDGAYVGYEGTSYMAICQDNYDLGSDYTPVEWTANDLDTIRHETIHAIQDCKVGENSDQVLAPIANDIRNVVRALGPDKANRIYQVYRERGADHETILLEWEAFYAAETLTATQIEQLYIRYCK